MGKTCCLCLDQTLLCCREERSFNQTLRQQQDEAYLESLKADQEKVNEGKVLFNDAFNTFYLQLYGDGHIVKDHSARVETLCVLERKRWRDERKRQRD